MAVEKFRAFGEYKSVHGWFWDKRCVVSLSVLKKRLASGQDPEEAISLPSRGTLYEAFGERKTFTQWLKDPRCARPASTIHRRLKADWSFEEAITLPQANDANTLCSAFGEQKTRRQWSQDPRFKVSYGTLRKRLRNDMPLEDALTRPMWAKEALPRAVQLRIAGKMDS